VPLDYTADIRNRYGAKATIRGNGPFALVSKCGQTRVYCFLTAEMRHNVYEAWHYAECGTKPCFGDAQHVRVKLEGQPTEPDGGGYELGWE